MKKGLLVLLSLLIVTCVFAFDKGTVNPGGTISFVSSKYNSNTDTYTEIYFGPQVGYFVIDDLSVDLLLGIMSGKQGDDKDTSFDVGVGARYFYNNFYGGLGFMMNSYKSESNFGDYKWSANYIDLKAGYLVPLAENVFADLGLKYEMGVGEYGGDGSGDNEYTQLTFGAGFQIFFPFMK